MKRVHNLQDAIKVSQQSRGGFEMPNWDPASQKKVRDALMVLGATLRDTKRMFGTKDQVDPVRRLIGAASVWGGNPAIQETGINAQKWTVSARIDLAVLCLSITATISYRWELPMLLQSPYMRDRTVK